MIRAVTSGIAALLSTQEIVIGGWTPGEGRCVDARGVAGRRVRRRVRAGGLRGAGVPMTVTVHGEHPPGVDCLLGKPPTSAGSFLSADAGGSARPRATARFGRRVR